MSETEKIINKIVADFEGAMGRLESKSIFSDIYGENQNDARIVRQNILKRILWPNLGTEAEQKKMLEPATEKAVEEALKEIKKRFAGLTFELDF